MITKNFFRYGLILATTVFATGTLAEPPPTQGPVVVIHVDRDGNIDIKNGQGHAKPQDCDLNPGNQPRCRGFGKDGHVLKMETLSIFRTEGSSCIIVYNSVNGVAQQICW